MPLALLAIFLILYLENRSVDQHLHHLQRYRRGLLRWIYSALALRPTRIPRYYASLVTISASLFQIKTINLSTAVWVGFIALFGIATDDGVVISTYLRQRFSKGQPANHRRNPRHHRTRRTAPMPSVLDDHRHHPPRAPALCSPAPVAEPISWAPWPCRSSAV